MGEQHKVGPDLSAIGAIAGGRVPDISAEEYLRQSILDPNAFIVEDCPNGPCIANIMPRDYTTRLSQEQVDSMVAYLLTLTEADTGRAIIGEDSDPAPKAFPAPKMISERTEKKTAVLAVQVLLLTLVFLLSLFRLLKPSDPDISNHN